MAGREFLFVALFLYFVSPGTCLSMNHANNDTGEMRARSRSSFNPVVQINYDWQGMVCSGVHLKNWIVATTADCVYGREPAKLSVTIKNDNKWGQPITAKVIKYMVNPDYRNGIHENNLALMLIKNNEHVMLFDLPMSDYSPHRIRDRKLKIYVSEWQELDYQRLVSHPQEYHAAGILERCFLAESKEGWYCIIRPSYGPMYKQRDVGTPMYFEDGKRKVLLGVYTGYKIGLAHAAYLCEKIYPMRQWIIKFMRKHPLPPYGK